MRVPQWKLDQEAIVASGHTLSGAITFFGKRGLLLARHPKYGWQFTAVLQTGVPGTCGFWHRIVGSVDALIEVLDAPSAVLQELREKQEQAMSRH